MLNGTLVSADCGVRVVLGVETQHMERYYSRAAHYTLLVSALTFFQVPHNLPAPWPPHGRAPWPPPGPLQLE